MFTRKIIIFINFVEIILNKVTIGDGGWVGWGAEEEKIVFEMKRRDARRAFSSSLLRA